MRALVADRDSTSRRAIVAALRCAGYLTHVTTGATRALKAVRRVRPDVVVVDPADEETVTQLRSLTDSPIIVVAAPCDSWGKVAALDAGADDYLAKPVDPAELLARVRAALRRARPPAASRAPIVTPDFTVQLDDRRWFRSDSSEVRLTPTEWRLVEVLTERAGHLVTQTELLERVWGPKAADKPHYLRVQLAAIRRKVEPDPAHPRYFITAPGLGLRFEPGTTAPLQPA